MFAIANGRKALWQWDLNQQLTVAGSCTEVHYLDKGSPSTLTVAVKDGKADIPNVLLQRPGRLVVYAYIVDAQDHHTKVCETFGVTPRPKPDDYVYTETEVKTWSDLQSQIGDLADLATEEKDNLVAAINEAARSGGGGGAWYVTVTPGTNHRATADKTAAEVYAAYEAGKAVYCILLDAIGVVPVVLPLLAAVAVNVDEYLFCFAGSGAPRVSGSAPFSLTVTYDGTWHYFYDELVSGELVNSVSSSSTDKQVPSAKCLYDELQERSLKQATSDTLGGVKADPATADDTQPVRIDDSGKLVTAAGSGSDISLGITSAAVGQTIKVKAVNGQGVPTAWEAADMAGGEKKEWTKIIDVEITEATMFFEATGLDNATELYCEWTALKTASETDKRDLDLYINDIAVGVGWVTNYASNGQLVCGYSMSEYNGLVWYNTKSLGIAGVQNKYNTSMGGSSKISYGLTHGVGAATKVKIKAFNAANAPVTGQIEVWAR